MYNNRGLFLNALLDSRKDGAGNRVDKLSCPLDGSSLQHPVYGGILAPPEYVPLSSPVCVDYHPPRTVAWLISGIWGSLPSKIITVFITARVRSTTGGYIFTGVFLSNFRGGGVYPIQLIGGRGTPFQVWTGDTPSSLWGQGIPSQVEMGGGTPSS